MDTYLFCLRGQPVLTLARCTVEQTKTCNLPVVNLPWDCDKDHRQIRAALQLRSTSITQPWWLWLTSDLPYTSLLTPAESTQSLGPCAGKNTVCGQVQPLTATSSILVYSLIWWNSKNNNQVYLWTERNFLLCTKKTLCFHLAKKNWERERGEKGFIFLKTFLM